MKKSLLLLFLFSALVAGSFAFDTADAPRYKNLKILPKKTTKEQMDVVMKHFNASLGVKCNFCHVFNQEQKAMDFASDANEHKGISRNMMRMQTKLNKKYFDVKNAKDLTARLEVTCQTCHNGKAHPATRVPAPAAQQQPASPPPAGTQQKAGK